VDEINAINGVHCYRPLFSGAHQALAASFDGPLVPLPFRPESAHEINDQGYHEQQANPATADDGTAKIKSAAAEQEQKNY